MRKGRVASAAVEGIDVGRLRGVLGRTEGVVASVATASRRTTSPTAAATGPSPSVAAGPASTTGPTVVGPTSRTLEGTGATRGTTIVVRCHACPRTGIVSTVGLARARTARVPTRTLEGRTTPGTSAGVRVGNGLRGSTRSLRTFARPSTTRTAGWSPPTAFRMAAPNEGVVDEGLGRRTMVACPTTAAHVAKGTA